MQQGNVMTREPLNIHPYQPYPQPHLPPEEEAPKDEPAQTAPRPKLTLKHLHSLIEALQEEQRQLAGRVDELTRLVMGGDGHGMAHSVSVRNEAEGGQPSPLPSAEWAVVAPPAAAGDGRTSSREDPPPLESILKELQEAARIADEIAEHAAEHAAAAGERPENRGESELGHPPYVPVSTGEQPNTRSEGASENPPSIRASSAPDSASVPQSPAYADFPILISRAERHGQRKRKRSMWSRLFGGASR